MSDDIPSDFFDDFSKEEFIDGLSVVDSWNDNPDKFDRKRVNNLSEVLDSVHDLRELIVRDISMEPYTSNKPSKLRSKSRDPLDDYIKPGSRRDPSKTYKAIKEDKEVKVKEILAKKLESSDDLQPPGTELDDFFEVNMKKRRNNDISNEYSNQFIPKDLDRERFIRRNRDRERFRERHKDNFDEDLDSRRHRNYRPSRLSPHFHRHRSPHFRSARHSRSPRHSPHHRGSYKCSPTRQSSFNRSPNRRNTYNRSPMRRSSVHRSPPPLFSRSPNHLRRNRSPYNKAEDNFLYPEPDYGSEHKHISGYEAAKPTFSGPPIPEYSAPVAVYAYPQTPAYTSFQGQYDFSGPAPLPVPAPQPVPAPTFYPSAGLVPPGQINSPAVLAPGPSVQVPVPALPESKKDSKTPFDALAQLVAEGKLSKEDYLKLAPNKGTGSGMDTKNRIAVLNRCQEALSRLDKFTLPNQLVMNTNIVGQDSKFLTPKFCSPLKRQAVIEFHFTTKYGTTAQQNKQLIDSIAETIGLSKTGVPSKKKVNKDMKDASVQTSKPFCEMCEIRESTRYYDVGTSVDHEYFSSNMHTQVVDHDLASSKVIFNPSGSKCDTGPVSMAHMTPAQMLSQLAARAKTLKQTNEPSPAASNYERRQYDQQYNNYSNYRY